MSLLNLFSEIAAVRLWTLSCIGPEIGNRKISALAYPDRNSRFYELISIGVVVLFPLLCAGHSITSTLS